MGAHFTLAQAENAGNNIRNIGGVYSMYLLGENQVAGLRRARALK